jgi:hypothetical protein
VVVDFLLSNHLTLDSCSCRDVALDWLVLVCPEDEIFWVLVFPPPEVAAGPTDVTMSIVQQGQQMSPCLSSILDGWASLLSWSCVKHPEAVLSHSAEDMKGVRRLFTRNEMPAVPLTCHFGMLVILKCLRSNWSRRAFASAHVQISHRGVHKEGLLITGRERISLRLEIVTDPNCSLVLPSLVSHNSLSLTPLLYLAIPLRNNHHFFSKNVYKRSTLITSSGIHSRDTPIMCSNPQNPIRRSSALLFYVCLSLRPRWSMLAYLAAQLLWAGVEQILVSDLVSRKNSPEVILDLCRVWWNRMSFPF